MVFRRHHASLRGGTHSVHDSGAYRGLGDVFAASAGILFFSAATCGVVVADVSAAAHGANRFSIANRLLSVDNHPPDGEHKSCAIRYGFVGGDSAAGITGAWSWTSPGEDSSGEIFPLACRRDHAPGSLLRRGLWFRHHAAGGVAGIAAHLCRSDGRHARLSAVRGVLRAVGNDLAHALQILAPLWLRGSLYRVPQCGSAFSGAVLRLSPQVCFHASVF